MAGTPPSNSGTSLLKCRPVFRLTCLRRSLLIVSEEKRRFVTRFSKIIFSLNSGWAEACRFPSGVRKGQEPGPAA